MRRVGQGVAAAVVLPAALVAAAGNPCSRPAAATEMNWHVVVVVAGEDDPATLSDVAALGADVAATLSPPSVASNAACAEAEIRYLARIPMSEVTSLPYRPDRVAEIRSMDRLVGVQYIDLDTLEGYETPETQALAYEILKQLFPNVLVVHALRLDPIAWDVGYLDRYYRPQYCDVVAPYFYPVGTTFLGTFEEGDDWQDPLRTLLRSVAAATPEGKPVLPVLQAFEQQGHPVSRAVPGEELAIYRETWPDQPSVAAFWWGGGLDEPLTGLASRADLRRALAALLGATPSRGRPCETGAARPP